MKVLEIKTLIFPDVKIIEFQGFVDNRGYFTETYRRSDFEKLDFLKGVHFHQTNESYSKKGIIRGLHFQWNPYIGKLVRTTDGHMIDLFLDIRKNSPTFGKIGAYEMSSKSDKNFKEWIWIPVGFAHGSFFIEDTILEYFCTDEYNARCEATILPFASDIDWSLVDKKLKKRFDDFANNNPIISEKDKNGFTVKQWLQDEKSNHFIYENLLQ